MGAEEDISALSMSRPEALAHRLEQTIIEEPLEPGARLGTKEDLRRTYGVAVGTVNEALRILEARGLVRARPGPGGGLFVAAPVPQAQLNRLIVDFRRQGVDALNCLEVRNALEPAVVAAAAQGVTADDIADLEEILDRMAANAADPPSYLRENWALHRRIAEICDNAVLRGIYIALLDFLGDQVKNVSPEAESGHDNTDNLALHRHLVTAIASGDVERARAAAHDHSPLVRVPPDQNPEDEPPGTHGGTNAN